MGRNEAMARINATLLSSLLLFATLALLSMTSEAVEADAVQKIPVDAVVPETRLATAIENAEADAETKEGVGLWRRRRSDRRRRRRSVLWRRRRHSPHSPHSHSPHSHNPHSHNPRCVGDFESGKKCPGNHRKVYNLSQCWGSTCPSVTLQTMGPECKAACEEKQRDCMQNGGCGTYGGDGRAKGCCQIVNRPHTHYCQYVTYRDADNTPIPSDTPTQQSAMKCEYVTPSGGR